MRQDKILIGTSHAGLYQRLDALFAHRGYLVAPCCSSQAEVIRLARRLTPELLILDDDLPGLSGLDLADLFLREEWLPVILLSKQVEERMVRKAAKSCFFAVIAKTEEDALLLEVAAERIRLCSRLTALKKELLRQKQEHLRQKELQLAKGMIMAALGVDEPAAHRWLQKQSMEQGLPLPQLAAALVARRLPLPRPD